MSNQEDLEMPGVYMMKNLTSGREYIGSTKNLYNRKQHHFRALKAGYHHIAEMQSDYCKGHEFEFVTLQTVDVSTPYLKRTLWRLEAWFIIERNAIQAGYNHKAFSYNDANARRFAINPLDLPTMSYSDFAAQ